MPTGPVIFIPTYGGSATSGGGGAAAAGTLTGTTLASNVVIASIGALTQLTSDGIVQTSGGTGALSVTTAPSIASLTLSSLTSGRVPFATTAGLLTDDADLTFATDTLTYTKGITTSLGVGTGATTPLTVLHVASTATTLPRGITSSQHSATADGAELSLLKSRGTLASPTVITTADVLGRITFKGHDGSNYLEMGAIRVTSTGTIASTRVPTTMEFLTATDAAPSVLTSRMSIAANGQVSLPTNTNSSSSVTGALILTGGIGVGGAVYVGGSIGVGSQVSVANGLSVGTTSFTNGCRFQILGNISGSSWLTTGVLDRHDAITGTNSSTAISGTAVSAVFTSFAQCTLAATNATVTTTDAANVYIAGDVIAGTNQTLTNSYGLWNVGKTRLDGNVLIGGLLAVGGAAISASTALNHPASTTAISSLRIASGAAPTSPVSGDCWYASGNLFFRDGSTTRTITWI